MPTYTYRCETCGHQFDIFQHFTDDALTECPQCGKQSLHKVYSPVGIVFKGSGFYSTDNRSPSGQTPVHHESSASEVITEGGSTEKASENHTSGSDTSKPAEASGSKGDHASG